MAKHRMSCWRKPPMSSSERQWNRSVVLALSTPSPLQGRVGEGVDAGATALAYSFSFTPTPNPSPQGGGELPIAGVMLSADISGALFWDEQSLLVVSDLHLEKGSSFATRGILLPPYDTVATL